MSDVFISYRRAETAPAANSVYTALANQLGDRRVFIDTTSIEKANDWFEHVRSTLKGARVLALLIGLDWLGSRGDGEKPAIFDDDDPVRIEVDLARAHELHIVPILVNGATMPRREDLPVRMQTLARNNAFYLRNESYHDDLRDIVAHIEKFCGVETATPESEAISVVPAPSTPQAGWTKPSDDVGAGELRERITRFEDMSQLGFEQFTNYVRLQSEYESLVLSDAIGARGNPDTDLYERVASELIAMNRRMAEICDRELGRSPDDLYRRDLQRYAALSTGFAMLLEGDVHQSRGIRLRLMVNTDGAADEFLEARNLYIDLADADLPQSEAARIRAVGCQYLLAVLQATDDMLRSQYQSARNTLREATILLREMIEELTALNASGGEQAADKVYRDSLVEFSTEMKRVQTLSLTASFHWEFHNGNFSDAVELGERMLQAHLELADVEQADTSDSLQQLSLMDYEVMAGWCNFAKAEVAVDAERWDAVRAHLGGARDHWESAVTAGIRSNLPIGLLAQNQTGVFDVLLRSATRHYERAWEYDKRIRQLESHSRGVDAGVDCHQRHVDTPPNIGPSRPPASHEASGRDRSVLHDEASTWGAPDDETPRPSAYARPKMPAQDAEADIASSASVQVMSRDDSKVRREVATELERLHTLLVAAARDTSERQAATSVADAVAAARRGDHAGVIAGLVGLDEWPLMVARSVRLSHVERLLDEHGSAEASQT